MWCPATIHHFHILAQAKGVYKTSTNSHLRDGIIVYSSLPSVQLKNLPVRLPRLSRHNLSVLFPIPPSATTSRATKNPQNGKIPRGSPQTLRSSRTHLKKGKYKREPPWKPFMQRLPASTSTQARLRARLSRHRKSSTSTIRMAWSGRSLAASSRATALCVVSTFSRPIHTSPSVAEEVIPSSCLACGSVRTPFPSIFPSSL